MRITVLCSSPHHPVNAQIGRWQMRRPATDEITVLRKRDELVGGDVLLLISCGELIGARHRALLQRTFVLHASDLPKGRGWNPLSGIRGILQNDPIGPNAIAHRS